MTVSYLSATRPWRVRLRKALAPLLAAIVYPLSHHVGRSPKRWVFGEAGDAFTGNPRFLFLWLSLHRRDIRTAWIGGTKRQRRVLRGLGLRAHARWSPAGIWATVRAGVLVFGHGLNDVNAQLSGGAFLLNLWHGVGLKTIHLGFAGGRTAAARRVAGRSLAGRLAELQYLKPYDALVTTSPAMQRHFSIQTHVAERHCPILGYPRLDVADDPALREMNEAIDARIGFVWPDGQFAEIWIYMPTYRDTGRPFLNVALSDPARLSRVLSARNALLFLKPHPETDCLVVDGYPNIRTWPEGVDVNGYLSRFSGLITDYSSVLYDWLAMRSGGVILYTFDMATYLARDRTLVAPYEENVAGVRAETFDALCDTLAAGHALTDDDPAEAMAVRARFWGGSPQPSSPAVVAYVEARLAERAV